jgi:hypothetical protein
VTIGGQPVLVMSLVEELQGGRRIVVHRFVLPVG